MRIALKDFLEQYPGITVTDGTSANSRMTPQGFKLIAHHYHHSTIWRHELCHFVERELDKCLLDNFGFPQGFGQNDHHPNLHDAKVLRNHKAFIYRELRVIAIEHFCPIDLEKDGGFSALHLNDEQKFPEYFLFEDFARHLEKYKLDFMASYSEDQWWSDFLTRYNLLSNHLEELRQSSLSYA